MFAACIPRAMKKPDDPKRLRRALRWAVLALLLLTVVFLLLEKNLETVILDMAHARAAAMAVEYIN